MFKLFSFDTLLVWLNNFDIFCKTSFHMLNCTWSYLATRIWWSHHVRHIFIGQVHFLIKKIYIQNWGNFLPQIFKGASNSSSIGCDRNISLDFRHSPLISFSESCTFFPGREPRTKIRILRVRICSRISFKIMQNEEITWNKLMIFLCRTF